MRDIGIGVIGTGFMGKAHSIAYSASASVFGTGLRPRLEIVCDLSPERASQRATDLGFNRYSSNWRDVVNDPAVELISVCTPNDTHAEISVAALAADKNVWCEKPMSTTLADSQLMTDAAAGSSALAGRPPTSAVVQSWEPARQDKLRVFSPPFQASPHPGHCRGKVSPEEVGLFASEAVEAAPDLEQL